MTRWQWSQRRLVETMVCVTVTIGLVVKYYYPPGVLGAGPVRTAVPGWEWMFVTSHRGASCSELPRAAVSPCCDQNWGNIWTWSSHFYILTFSVRYCHNQIENKLFEVPMLKLVVMCYNLTPTLVCKSMRRCRQLAAATCTHEIWSTRQVQTWASWKQNTDQVQCSYVMKNGSDNEFQISIWSDSWLQMVMDITFIN